MKLPLRLSVCFVIVSLAIAVASVHGEVYKVVDKSGRVTYTDKPPPSHQGEKVNLPKINTQLGIEVPVTPTDDTQPDASGYDKIEILQPKNGATIPPGQLDMIIQVGITPVLQSNHRVSILLNGKPVGKPASTTSILLDNLERGAHRIEAKVVDEQGIKVGSSQVISIYVHRASKLIKPKTSPGK